ncbi:MAG: V-type ATPase 116kDa subunit family protein [bacterium]
MFSAVSMLRLSVVVLERDERAVLRELGRLGAVQLLRQRAGPNTAPLEPRDRTAELARCDNLLARSAKLRDSLGIPPTDVAPPESQATSLDIEDGNLLAMESQAGELLASQRGLSRHLNDTNTLAGKLTAYRGVEIPLDRIGDFSFLHFVTGSLPVENLAQLQATVGNNVALLPMPGGKECRQLIAMTTRSGRDALDKALQQAGFLSEALPAVDDSTPDTVVERSLIDRDKTTKELEGLDTAIKALASSLAGPVSRLEQAVNTERHMLNAEQSCPRTGSAVLLTGWLPAGESAAVEAGLRAITGGRCSIAATPPEGIPEEDIPVLVRHHRLLRPFGMLVAAYSLPKYRELDPALFVAVSYVLMFGMMFGDAGHGAVLAIGGLAALLAGRTATTRDMGLLLLMGGISSVGFGIIYGSYFGITAVKQYAIWHDPIEGDPMGIIYCAVGMGIALISTGMILNIINHLRRGDILGGILDKFGAIGLLFYWGSLFMVTNYAAINAVGLATAAGILFLGLPILGWSLKEPIQYARHRLGGLRPEPGGLFVAVTESLVGAFEAALSYLANTISFVRLAAYAMSHAALLMATFMLAAEVRHTPAVGPALGVLVIIGGNLVAIALEGLIGAVQALRLEYYEFFGKFFSGGGRPFTPFRLAPGCGPFMPDREAP